jgi:L-amino acid N-acyltransferase YncA
LTIAPAAPDPSQPTIIRDTVEADLPAIQAIYEQAVLHGLATFEEVPPTVAEMSSRLAGIRDLDLPFLTAELDGTVVGYSYARPYRPRPAYRHTVEDSVYVAEGMQGRGVGRALLAGLIERCEEGDWRQMIAVIGDINNAGSIALHRNLDFRETGTLEAVGFKLGQWVDTVLMQRALGPGGAEPPS